MLLFKQKLQTKTFKQFLVKRHVDQDCSQEHLDPQYKATSFQYV